MSAIKNLFAHKSAGIIFILFSLFVLWRVALFFLPNTDQINLSLSSIFWWGGLYQIVAIVGGICGLQSSKQWGGYKSILGRSISSISIGLLLQAFGQSVATYYVYYNVQGIYPSVADIGFFGSVIMYIYGALLLVQIVTGKLKKYSLKSKLLIVLVPLCLLVASYFVFLQGYEFDFSSKIKTILDLGYPLGQAFYVSMALLALILSKKLLGGIMKIPILFLLVAFLFQYASDFNFLYQNNNGLYIPGGFVDIMYLTSYLVMSICLVRFSSTFKEINRS